MGLAVGVGPWTTFTPTFSSVGGGAAAGNATLVGAYRQLGKLLAVRIYFQVGSTTTGGSGNWQFALPTTAGVAAQQQMLSAFIFQSAGYSCLGQVGAGGSQIQLLAPVSSGNCSLGNLTATFPVNWTPGHNITIEGVIEVQ